MDYLQEESDVQLKDIRLELRAKNNILWDKIHEHYPSVSAFCKAHAGQKIGPNVVGRLLAFKESPFRQQKVAKNVYQKVYSTICLRIEKALGWPAEQLFPEELYQKMMDMPTTRVIEISSFGNLLPLEKKELLSLPAPEENSDPVLRAIDSELKEKIKSVLNTLSYRQREIIKLRYGLEGGHIFTLEEVAKIFKIPKERVRVIEQTALQNLRNPGRSRRLESFVE